MQLSYDSFGLLASYKDNVGKTTNMTGAPDGKTVKREVPGNGGSLLTISDDYNIQIKKDGSEIITIKLFGAGILIGNCSKTVPSKPAHMPLDILHPLPLYSPTSKET